MLKNRSKVQATRNKKADWFRRKKGQVAGEKNVLEELTNWCGARYFSKREISWNKWGTGKRKEKKKTG